MMFQMFAFDPQQMFTDFILEKFFSPKLGKGKRVSITLHLVAISEHLLCANGEHSNSNQRKLLDHRLTLRFIFIF